MSLYETGVRPIMDKYLLEKAKEKRDYGEFWSASSAGYCMRKNIFERLGVPHVETDQDARKQRVFEAGHVFHQWAQELTKNAGVSIAQELELEDTSLMVRGHIDDLVLIDDNLMLLDYKTVNSKSFKYRNDLSYYHAMQLGTYMYMLRMSVTKELPKTVQHAFTMHTRVSEARILLISKDDLRMKEHQLMWSEDLEEAVVSYWTELNRLWNEQKIPPCTCADHEGGFMALEKWNPYFYDGKPCSIELYKAFKEEKQKEVVSV